MDNYSLAVEVSDSGTPQLTARTVVNIEVEDSNDCPPVFSHDNYTAVVQVSNIELRISGTKIQAAKDLKQIFF